ncbi:MAG: hypothetical protein PW792_01170 [Acidobacteriaceae bacterium]|nr:hypothetical protein [Acidobacteriaceae bacterium]
MQSPLQFDRAVYLDGDAPLHCTACGRELHREFFTLNKNRICSVCAGRVQEWLPTQGRKTLLKSAAWGVAAAIGASILLYLALQLCYLIHQSWAAWICAIFVGMAIGKAMRSAASGAGGRSYQVIASVLTYCAICVAMLSVLLGTRDVPLWAFLLFPFAPFIQLVIGERQMAAYLLLIAAVGVRWVWIQLPPSAVVLVGPLLLPHTAPETAAERPELRF